MRLLLAALALFLSLEARAVLPESPDVEEEEGEGELPLELEELLKGLMGRPPAAAAAPAAVKDPEPRAKAQALQDYGLPPSVYIEDPSTVFEAQALVRLYSIEDSTPTMMGRGLLELFDASDADSITRLTRKRIALVLLRVRKLVECRLDRRCAAQKRLLETKAAAVAAAMKEPLAAGEPDCLKVSDPNCLGLGKAKASLRETLALRESALRAVLLVAEGAGLAAPDKAAVMTRVAEALQGLQLEGEGRPLTPETLELIVKMIPEKDLSPAQWRALFDSCPNGRSLRAAGVDKVWRGGVNGKGVTIAVLDTGIDWTHPYFEGFDGRDGRNLTHHVYTDHRKDKAGNDLYGTPNNGGNHGTHVAGTIAAHAPGATIVNIKVLDEEAKSDIAPELVFDEVKTISAIAGGLKEVYEHNERVKAGTAPKDGPGRIDVISMSLGIPGSNVAVQDGNLDLISEWVKKLSDSGVSVIVCAGNESTKQGVRRPGMVNEAITVGAVDYFGRVTEFSSEQAITDMTRNAIVRKPDVFSYGLAVTSAKYDAKGSYASARAAVRRVAERYGIPLSEGQADAMLAALDGQSALGWQDRPNAASLTRALEDAAIRGSVPLSSERLSSLAGDLSVEMNGTSMATPHVAGITALLIQEARGRGVELTPAQVKEALVRSGDATSTGNPYTTGAITNLQKALAYVRDNFLPKKTVLAQNEY